MASSHAGTRLPIAVIVLPMRQGLRDERRSPPVRPNDSGTVAHFLSKE
ncbi:MAG: hypothetical protein K2N26_00220 [Oscillospiraceae bacterium]|nr:hypothetical protein [Oscillospiraceae bacterium]MDE7278144.1 hypothetical protein [Oscillospiraceae bacterium]